MHSWHAVPGYFASAAPGGVVDSGLSLLAALPRNGRLIPNYHFALGMVLRVKGNLSGAMGEFTKELELNPGHQADVQQAAEIQRQIVGK